MGASLSRFRRLIKNPLQTQGRVDQILESKPITAPKHASSVDAIERIRSETAEEFKKQDNKDDKFLDILKDLKVESTDVNIAKETSYLNQEPRRKLPQVRYSQGNFRSNEVREGKITAQNLTELFKNRINSPKEWTAEIVSGHYKLDAKDVESLLKYFSGYAVVETRELPKPLENMSFIE